MAEGSAKAGIIASEDLSRGGTSETALPKYANIVEF